MSGIETEIAGFTAKYAPPIAAALKACRRRMHGFFPRGFELVYDNYNALVFGYAPSERASDAIVSIAGYPRWITLFFLHGATLHDPDKLLQGDGKQVRGIRLVSPADFDNPAVRALLQRAIAPHADAFAAAPRLATIVKSVSAAQRSRRPGGGTARASRAATAGKRERSKRR
jgi:hypothetical protein